MLEISQWNTQFNFLHLAQSTRTDGNFNNYLCMAREPKQKLLRKNAKLWVTGPVVAKNALSYSHKKYHHYSNAVVQARTIKTILPGGGR